MPDDRPRRITDPLLRGMRDGEAGGRARFWLGWSLSTPSPPVPFGGMPF